MLDRFEQEVGSSNSLDGETNLYPIMGTRLKLESLVKACKLPDLEAPINHVDFFTYLSRPLKNV